MIWLQFGTGAFHKSTEWWVLWKSA